MFKTLGILIIIITYFKIVYQLLNIVDPSV